MVLRDACDANAPRLQVDDEEHEMSREPLKREHLNGEEVRGGDGAPMGLQKGLPGQSLPSTGSRLESVLGEDALNGGASEEEAEILERTAKARVAPRRIRARHRYERVGRVSALPRAPRSAASGAVVLGGDELSVPAQNRFRGCKRGDFGELLSAERLSLLGEKPSLCVRELQARGGSRARRTRFSARRYSSASPW